MEGGDIMRQREKIDCFIIFTLLSVIFILLFMLMVK